MVINHKEEGENTGITMMSEDKKIIRTS